LSNALAGKNFRKAPQPRLRGDAHKKEWPEDLAVEKALRGKGAFA
jgi:hypothetical protein